MPSALWSPVRGSELGSRPAEKKLRTTKRDDSLAGSIPTRAKWLCPPAAFSDAAANEDVALPKTDAVPLASLRAKHNRLHALASARGSSWLDKSRYPRYA